MTVGGEMLPELLLARDLSAVVVDCRVKALVVVVAIVEGMQAAAPSASDDDEGIGISISIPTDPAEKQGASVMGSLL